MIAIRRSTRVFWVCVGLTLFGLVCFGLFCVCLFVDLLVCLFVFCVCICDCFCMLMVMFDGVCTCVFLIGTLAHVRNCVSRAPRLAWQDMSAPRSWGKCGTTSVGPSG